VTCRRQSTETREGLVDWTCVRVSLAYITKLCRFHPDVWHLSKEYLRVRLFERSQLRIIATALKEQAVDVGAIWGLFGFAEILFVQDLVLPAD